MSANMPRAKRTMYRISKEELVNLLAKIASYGIVNQGHDVALNLTKKIFFAVKGNEKRPITTEEALKLLK